MYFQNLGKSFLVCLTYYLRSNICNALGIVVMDIASSQSWECINHIKVGGSDSFSTCKILCMITSIYQKVKVHKDTNLTGCANRDKRALIKQKLTIESFTTKLQI